LVALFFAAFPDLYRNDSVCSAFHQFRDRIFPTDLYLPASDLLDRLLY